MSDNDFKEKRKQNRERLLAIWEIAKTGDLESLAGEEKRFAEAMIQHKDQYSSHFENADQIYDREYDPKSEENPFLHIMLHSVVEGQLESKEPIEALQFFNSMRKKKVSRHDTIHLIGVILTPLMLNVMQQRMCHLTKTNTLQPLRNTKVRSPKGYMKSSKRSV
jgi:hypothetical protein